MSRALRVGVIALVVLALAGVIVLKRSRSEAVIAEGGAASVAAAAQAPRDRLPKLIDLGANACIPCKKMKPILDELRVSHAERFEVVFIDVWQDPSAAEPFGIRLIPTQIFYGPDGEELFRHEGFFSREDILAKWGELGFRWDAPAAQG